MTLKIFHTGEPVLRQQAKELSAKEILSNTIQTLIADMKETVRAAPGVGLAAPQIGESLQLAVIEDRAEYLERVPSALRVLQERNSVPFHVIINPKITLLQTEGEKTFFEGCLSIPGFVGLVPRVAAVHVTCMNEHAQPIIIHARGWCARILQHEIGHLNGELCIDHAHIASWITVENYMNYWHAKPIHEAYAYYGIQS